jgi:tRNA(fMet)-specific endonuclease VapC
MSLFILDTDHLTLLQHDHPSVKGRVLAADPKDLAITLITIEEQLSGWYTKIRKAKKPKEIATAYAGLFQSYETTRRLRVLPFSTTAVDRYFQLRKAHPRSGKMDLAIAAITLTLEGNAILVTRNRQDFEMIEGLVLENWSQ